MSLSYVIGSRLIILDPEGKGSSCSALDSVQAQIQALLGLGPPQKWVLHVLIPSARTSSDNSR